MSPKDFINAAAKACYGEMMATIQNENIRQHWEMLVRKYLWAHEDQWTHRMEEIRKLILEIARSCPCGARSESLATHPHMWGCAVQSILWLMEDRGPITLVPPKQKGANPDPTSVPTPIK